MLQELVKESFTTLQHLLVSTTHQLHVREIGKLLDIGGGIARIKGLSSVTSDELVSFHGGVLGVAINLAPNEVGVMMLSDDDQITAGDEVHTTGREVDTPVGEALLGRVIDPTGKVLDNGEPINATQRLPIERPAPAIMDRAPVNVPLETGIKVIDALIPIGRGQRELIMGDRQTGKTSVAIDTIINQRDKNVMCIYCAIGQRGAAVADVINTLREHNALEYTIVVVASDQDTPGLRFVAPYAATSMAEYFMLKGHDVLLVIDDLTRHARAYRELSLLLRRPPGREAYPGDIFYIHSRLLERATHLHERLGGGSLTTLPIVETQSQDIAAYIPTNLISITDGQIYLSPTLFHKGLLPAVDVGMSVSRVGGKTQYPSLRAVAAELRLSYSQFEELETFARFDTRLDQATRATIEHGRRVREVLKQAEHQPQRASEQIIILKAVNEGLLDDFAMQEISKIEVLIQQELTHELPELCNFMDAGGMLEDNQWLQVLQLAKSVIETQQQSNAKTSKSVNHQSAELDKP
ncbi:MAG: F-type H+-transporting ATPase subunit alpha [Arenicella sp.]|jgi:F-type H+-transporting ATPase subunit alpha